jgi:hypothetical protein
VAEVAIGAEEDEKDGVAEKSDRITPTSTLPSEK